MLSVSGCCQHLDLSGLDYHRLSVVIRAKIFIGLRHQLNQNQKVGERNQGSHYYVRGIIMKELNICRLMENSITEPRKEITFLESHILSIDMHVNIITSK